MPNEEENIQMLQAMMGGLDAALARRTLLKHSGDIHAAAAELLDLQSAASEVGKPGADTDTDAWPMSLDLDAHVPARPNTPRIVEPQAKQRKDVIDLTEGYDSELSRALAMSLDPGAQGKTDGGGGGNGLDANTGAGAGTSTTNDGAVFRPSTRAPHPDWAMVPSNAPTSSTQETEDQSLSRAIQASLSSEDRYEEYSNEERIRQPGYPVALRSRKAELLQAPLILQALFSVPQVRYMLTLWLDAEDSDITIKRSFRDLVAFSLQSLFTFMDLALFSHIEIDGLEFWSGYSLSSMNGSPDRIGELSNELYARLVGDLKSIYEEVSPSSVESLFHLRYAAPGAQTESSTNVNEVACVKVDVCGSNVSNDLVSCLASQMGLDRHLPPSIVSASTVVAFELIRTGQTPAANQAGQKPVLPFRYPMHVYLDQFLQENRMLTEQRREVGFNLQDKLEELDRKKLRLTYFQEKDTIRSLESAVHYYEKIAPVSGANSSDRLEELRTTALKLRKILTRVENEVELINTQISQIQAEINKVYDDPALQKHRYDLRAVLVHDGLFGRNHIHSFIQHQGRWFRTQDANVVEVSEEIVLTDATGLQLGAGPYMLIYSRECEDVDVRRQWPYSLRMNVVVDDESFMREIHQAGTEEARLRLNAIYDELSSALYAPEEGLGDEGEEGVNLETETDEHFDGEVGETADAGNGVGEGKEHRRSMSAMSLVQE